MPGPAGKGEGVAAAQSTQIRGHASGACLLQPGLAHGDVPCPAAPYAPARSSGAARKEEEPAEEDGDARQRNREAVTSGLAEEMQLAQKAVAHAQMLKEGKKEEARREREPVKTWKEKVPAPTPHPGCAALGPIDMQPIRTWMPDMHAVHVGITPRTN